MERCKNQNPNTTHNIKWLPQRTVTPPINTMTMRRTHHIRPRRMHRRMNHIRCRIQQAARPPIDDLPVVVHQDEVTALDQAEGHAERVHPEGGRVDGVAECYVACDTFVVAQFAEDAEGEGEAAFQVGSFFVFVGEARG